MMPGINFTPLTADERAILALQTRGLLCACCADLPPWGPSADVCARCEARLVQGLIAQRCGVSEERISARLDRLRARIDRGEFRPRRLAVEML